MSEWISVETALPEHDTRVIARYEGVYEDRGAFQNRGILFWLDEGGNQHFGGFAEIDGKGSQPATHWMPLTTGNSAGESE